MSETPKWYVVHTYSGYENKVSENIEKVIENKRFKDLIFDYLFNILGYFVFITGISMDNIPFRSFRHKLSSFRALRAEEQPYNETEEIVNKADADRRDDNDYNNNGGVVDDLFFAGPCNFFELTTDVFEETFYSREKGRLFRSIFISHG